MSRLLSFDKREDCCTLLKFTSNVWLQERANPIAGSLQLGQFGRIRPLFRTRVLTCHAASWGKLYCCRLRAMQACASAPDAT